MRKLFLVLTILLIISLTVQFYFAAYAVFSTDVEEGFFLHGMNGRFVLPILALLVIIGAALARAGGRTIGLSVVPLALILFQTVLFIITGAVTGAEGGGEIPVAASIMLGFHAIVGLAAFVVSYMLIQRARRLIATGSATVDRERDVTPVTR
ncbi:MULTISPECIES: DUF6220 domain-containing protein [unclassified Salinibacterium]|uniref:DUF6220 domain-containing protein n=1 Tax=unclassified Salinibacterium TaxID=2632331 RepID=UPI00141FC433|nr:MULTISPECIES: DUF6220 domain-containing protein [unclassified Salinibacterium]